MIYPGCLNSAGKHNALRSAVPRCAETELSKVKYESLSFSQSSVDHVFSNMSKENNPCYLDKYV